jgi:hypothetical protein
MGSGCEATARMARQDVALNIALIVISTSSLAESMYMPRP